MTPRILFVLTSASQTLMGDSTGYYLPEAAHPYYVLSPHFDIHFAAPEGPNPPIDPSSRKEFKDDEECKRFLNDSTVNELLNNAKTLSAVQPDDYVAIFYVGGRGPVIDLPTNMANIQLANNFYRSEKIIAAVCHGPAALVGVTSEDRTSIFKGKTVTGFSNAEEEYIGDTASIPFLLETRVKALGATYVKADKLWDPKVVKSDKLMTGQNPASARPLAEALLEELKAKAA